MAGVDQALTLAPHSHTTAHHHTLANFEFPAEDQKEHETVQLVWWCTGLRNIGGLRIIEVWQRRGFGGWPGRRTEPRFPGPDQYFSQVGTEQALLSGNEHYTNTKITTKNRFDCCKKEEWQRWQGSEYNDQHVGWLMVRFPDPLFCVFQFNRGTHLRLFAAKLKTSRTASIFFPSGVWYAVWEQVEEYTNARHSKISANEDKGKGNREDEEILFYQPKYHAFHLLM